MIDKRWELQSERRGVSPTWPALHAHVGLTPRRSPLVLLFLVLLLLSGAPTPARADSGSRAPAASSVLFAESISWRGFVRYWKGFGHRADRVVLIVALIGGLAFAIIAFGGRWRR